MAAAAAAAVTDVTDNAAVSGVIESDSLAAASASFVANLKLVYTQVLDEVKEKNRLLVKEKDEVISKLQMKKDELTEKLERLQKDELIWELQKENTDLSERLERLQMKMNTEGSAT